MNTLLLRLAGPLQAWGSFSKFNVRSTEREPTKSGVLGMIASAMGRSRDEKIEDLNSLCFGVRVDQEGKILNDYHMVNPGKAKDSTVTHRYYLTDAIFIVGLEGDDTLLRDVESAIKNPVYPLFLGRRACPPTQPILLGLRDGSLRDTLNKESWWAADWYRKSAPQTVNLRLICDAEESDTAINYVRDRPISYAQIHRKHGFRSVSLSNVGLIDSASDKNRSKYEQSTDHDPFTKLREFNKGG